MVCLWHVRKHQPIVFLVSKVLETLYIDGCPFELTSQQFVDYNKNQDGEKYIISYKQDNHPSWTYMVHGVILKKEMIMAYHENTVGIRYELIETCGKEVTFEVKPALYFCERVSVMKHEQAFITNRTRIQCEFIQT